MKKLIILYLIVGTYSSASAQDILTVEDAVQIALENNYDIKIAENTFEITENDATLGNAGFLPRVTASFNRNFGRQSFDQLRASGDVREESGVKSNSLSYGARLDWTIFNGLGMFVASDILKELSALEKENLKFQIQTTIFELQSSFYLAAAEKERLRLLNSNVTLSEDRLQVAKQKYELGKASKLEYLQAQVDLNADRSNYIQQIERLARGKFDLLQLMALDADSIEFDLGYTLLFDNELNLNELLSAVEMQNPELTSLKKRELLRHQNELLVKSEMLPSVGLFADFTHTNSESPAGFVVENTSDNITYGLSASWVLFDGFNLQRRKQNARIDSETAQFQYENRLLAIKTDIKTNYLNYRNNLDLLTLEKENLEVAKENNEIAQERYEIGLSNALELRESQINLINAELRAQNAAFAAKVAEITLQFLAGTSTKTK